MPQSDLDKRLVNKHEAETMSIRLDLTTELSGPTCTYPMPQWDGGLCNLHHLTEDHEFIMEKCKEENFKAAKRLLKRFPDDLKLRQALIEGGWITQDLGSGNAPTEVSHVLPS